MRSIDRREFLKYSAGGLAALYLGGCTHWLPKGTPVLDPVLDITITDAMKEMVTHNAINDARCYFWIYKSNIPELPPDIPGPMVFVTEGEMISLTLTNKLDEPHSLFIPGIFDSGPVMPGATGKFTFTATKTGSFLYYDNLNAPVNRVMGLHGAFIVMPGAPLAGHKFTPYAHPTAAVQQLFDDFGSAPHWPGLAWEEGDPSTDTVPFRQHVWLLHEASSRLFAEVGNTSPGMGVRIPANFLEAFQHDPFRADGLNRKPEFFTISGQSGHFAHNNPYICPMHRVGEPTLVRILNAGLMTHSMHIHANHVYVPSVNGVVQDNVLWGDTFTSRPSETMDFVLPYMRPPDIPNVGGVGRADTPLVSVENPPAPGVVGSTAHPVWPPVEELNTFLPPKGTKAGVIDISAQMSPQCYPMHDHSESTQTAQGGNYNCGLITGINFTGDRNTPGGVTTFPNAPDNPANGPDFRKEIVTPTVPFVF